MDNLTDPHLSICTQDLISSTCLSISRQQFINDIKIAIGDPHEITIPLSIKPILHQLLEASDKFLQTTNEDTFMLCFYKAMEVCGQGWHRLGCWSASEQNDCYSIFWGLKVGLEKYQRASQKIETKQKPSAVPFWQKVRSPALALVKAGARVLGK